MTTFDRNAPRTELRGEPRADRVRYIQNGYGYDAVFRLLGKMDGFNLAEPQDRPDLVSAATLPPVETLDPEPTNEGGHDENETLSDSNDAELDAGLTESGEGSDVEGSGLPVATSEGSTDGADVVADPVPADSTDEALPEPAVDAEQTQAFDMEADLRSKSVAELKTMATAMQLPVKSRDTIDSLVKRIMGKE